MLQPSIYSFKSYREYLRAFYEYQKSLDVSYSYKKFSIKAKITSPNLLKLVMDGDKNLSTVTIFKFAKGLGLDAEEVSLFETMVLENQATDPTEKNYYSKRLKSFAAESKGRVFKISAKSSLFDRPLMPALIVFLAGAPVSHLDQAEHVLPLTSQEIKDMVRVLEDEKIITRSNEKFHVDFDHAIFHRSVSDVKLKSFLRSQLAMTSKAFDRTYENGGKFYSHSMGTTKDRLPLIEEKIKKVISDINSQFSFEPAEDVVQLNVQMFCLSYL